MSFTERFLFLIVVICFIQITVKTRNQNSAIMKPNHRLLGAKLTPIRGFGWYLNKEGDGNKSLIKVLEHKRSRTRELSPPTRTGRGRRFRRERSVTEQLSPEATPSKTNLLLEPIKDEVKTASSLYTAFVQGSKLRESTNKPPGEIIKPTRTTEITLRPVFKETSSLGPSSVNKTEKLPSEPSNMIEKKTEETESVGF